MLPIYEYSVPTMENCTNMAVMPILNTENRLPPTSVNPLTKSLGSVIKPSHCSPILVAEQKNTCAFCRPTGDIN